jgi:hypothetical protein
MPIEVFCESCQKKLRVPDTAAGKRIKCPKCQGVISVPAGDAAAVGGAATAPAIPTPSRLANKSSGSINVPKLNTPAPTPKSSIKLPSKAVVEQWYVQTEDGQQYGPVTRQELDQWYAEGRVTTDTQLLRDGGEQWQWASDLYPDLAPQQPAGGVPDFGAMSAGGAPAGGSGPFNFSDPNPYASPTTTTTSRGKGKGKRGGKKGGSPQIDTLAIVCYVMGGLGVLSGVAIMAIGGALAASLSGSDAAGAGAAGGGMFAIMGIFVAVVASVWFAAGYGLQQRAGWGRILTLVLAALSVLNFPVGTAVGVWAFMLLLDKDNAAAFR